MKKYLEHELFLLQIINTDTQQQTYMQSCKAQWNTYAFTGKN